MTIFIVVLLILVGVVFIAGPAGLLAGLTPQTLDYNFWVGIIFIYYILATLLPIDKIIGKIYPVFGFALLFMALSLIIALMAQGYRIPELTFDNLQNYHYQKEQFPVFPMLFITIASVSYTHLDFPPILSDRIMITRKHPTKNVKRLYRLTGNTNRD